MIWRLCSPPHAASSLPSISSTGDTQEDWERETACWREGGGIRGWGRSRIIRPWESLVLYSWSKTKRNRWRRNSRRLSGRTLLPSPVKRSSAAWFILVAKVFQLCRRRFFARFKLDFFSPVTESIEWFIEDQDAFGRMIWLLCHPLHPCPPPLPVNSSTGDTQEDWEKETTCWWEWGEWGGGGGAESSDSKKA